MRTAPARLPLPAIPLPGEILDSYLPRLAARNHLPFAAMRRALAADPVARLADYTGLRGEALTRALPELTVHGPALRARFGTRCPACTRCCASRGAVTATVLATADRAICRKHRRWIGGPALRCSPGEQFSCRTVPAIGIAATRHHRLTATWGDAITHDAFDDAAIVLAYWHHHGILAHTHDPSFTTVCAQLGWDRVNPVAASIAMACRYPAAVALTAIILRARGRVHLHDEDPRVVTADAVAMIGRDVLTDFEIGGATDPIRSITTSVLWTHEAHTGGDGSSRITP